MRHLRLSFARHGCDVSAFGDHEIGEALLKVATPSTHSSQELLRRAFERLQKSGTRPRFRAVTEGQAGMRGTCRR